MLNLFQVTGRLRATGYGFVICDVGLGFFAICGICVMISLFWSVCPRLQPKAGVISGGDPDIPLLKWVGPKRLKEAQDLADVADVSECVGYAAAVDDRSKAMEDRQGAQEGLVKCEALAQVSGLRRTTSQLFDDLTMGFLQTRAWIVVSSVAKR